MAVTNITTSNTMLITIACTGGNDVPDSDAPDDPADVDVTVDDVYVADDGAENSFDICDNEASVRFAARDPISSNFNCSIQIDNNWLGAVFTPPCRFIAHNEAMIFNNEKKKN